jgi:aspartate-semialdehyde dehydrogenase
MKKVKVAILGACGVLGQRFVQMLNEHPIFEVSVLVDVYKGKKYGEATNWGRGSGGFDDSPPEYAAEMEVSSVDDINADVALVFSGLPPDVAGPVESDLADKGYIVVSKAKDHRLERDVPLIIPEVNPDHLERIEIQRKKRSWDGAIVCAPNCTTSVFTLPLKPVYDKFGVESVVLTTMQAISGGGYPGVPSLDVTDNIVPYIEGEEEKTRLESKKILGSNNEPADYKLASSCCRAHVIDGHMECLFVKTRQKAGAEEVKRLMREFPGTGLHTGPEKPIIVRDEVNRPQTRLDRYAGNGKSPYVKGMSVTVGRIRNDEVFGLSFIALGHNTIRGGAGEAILIGELLERKNYL